MVLNNESTDRAARWLIDALDLPPETTPFPWQIALFHRFLQNDIPAAVDIPTGLGKSSVMALWLVARALGVPIPRRLVYVVDRRVLVDQATTNAMTLRHWVDHDPEVHASLGLTPGQSLPISTLRGQYTDNQEWLTDPAAPAIIIGTVDMIGSRLLFSGYGVSRKMRPYHAGLLGADALLVLDEAHLVPPFGHLIQTLAHDPAFHPPTDPVPPWRSMLLTATTAHPSPQSLTLTAADYQHPMLTQRLYAKKTILLYADPSEKQNPNKNQGKTHLTQILTAEAWHLLTRTMDPQRIVVYVDQQDIAQKTFDQLHRLKRKNPRKDVTLLLLTGQRRGWERDQTFLQLFNAGLLANAPLPSTSVILVATAAGEVGIDLDADHAVMDVVAWPRLVQRLGRVNRRGTGTATIVFVDPGDAENTTNPQTLRQTALALVRQLPRDADGWDGSPAALADLAIRARSDPTLQPLWVQAHDLDPLYPPVTRSVIDAWSLTALPHHPGRSMVEPWIRGWHPTEPPRTTVIWRALLPSSDTALWPPAQVEDFWETAPPQWTEMLETYTTSVREWLKARVTHVWTTQHPSPDTLAAMTLNPDGTVVQQWTWDALRQNAPTTQDLAGRLLVVTAGLGGLSPEGTLAKQVDDAPPTADTGSWPGIPFRVRRIAQSDPPQPEPSWRLIRQWPLGSPEADPTAWLVIEAPLVLSPNEEARSISQLQRLDDHRDATAQAVRQLATRLALPPAATRALELAALWHDAGKADPIWQDAFHAPPNGGPYAKTPGPVSPAVLQGYRHEFGSLWQAVTDPTIQALDPTWQDLVLHLIAAHHGNARPTIRSDGCTTAPPSARTATVSAVAQRFARLQATWGPWGLAWWETILRAADQQASQAMMMGGDDPHDHRHDSTRLS
ncbi:MAG: hypothetical protein C7B47_15625 [Sulfobacillus thermosulfidooxidans]|uniref:HD Cas3-type domain-containing protein n=1 Tax=Sulfobacillus thermosulfidooxidans TaxID=28034 RepID=A0A2T2WNA3_SULTH|nr:MAG: hypothetical protein C7B47_15625 [Sulfobacillus thermosulfidooxidans]